MASRSLPSVCWFYATRSCLLAALVSASFVACRKHQGTKADTDACPPVAGQALRVERVTLRPESPRAPEGVIDSQEALSRSGYEIQGEARPVPPEGIAPVAERPPVDFGKHRIAYRTVRQNPNASVVWIVEAPTEIVVGLRVPDYCGGAAPPDSLIAALVPASSKPVRFATCSTNACDHSIPRP